MIQNAKILLLIPSLSTFGGTEKVVANLSRMFSEVGYEAIEASFDAPGLDRRFDSPSVFYSLGPIPQLPLLLRPYAYAVSAWRLRTLKKRLGITHTISNLWRSDLISILSGTSDKKIALCHINILDNVSNRLMLSFRWLVAFIYRRFDRVIAVSEPLSEELSNLYTLNSAKVGFINNFIYRPDAKHILPDDGKQRYLWCGRFNEEKNVAGLLHCWARFCQSGGNHQLLLLGDGPLKQDLLDLADRLGMRIGTNLDDASAQVIFAGKVSNPADYMLGCRALLLSSSSEGLPMVVLEALSLGLPVLSSDCPSGGVRTALSGEGIFNPVRRNVQSTLAGLLLPVPDEKDAEGLNLWQESLKLISENQESWLAWRDGALSRACHFSSVQALPLWQVAIEDRQVNS
jgi:glycosyltransferase involved in cell wall biosynthesis